MTQPGMYHLVFTLSGDDYVTGMHVPHQCLIRLVHPERVSLVPVLEPAMVGVQSRAYVIALPRLADLVLIPQVRERQPLSIEKRTRGVVRIIHRRDLLGVPC